MTTAPVKAHWYDYPHYYDVGFRKDTPLECDFFEAAFRKYCPFPVRRLLEPACGSGRLVLEMARRGYSVIGYDLNEPSLDFLRKRLRRAGQEAEVLRGDMTDFRTAAPVDGAFNTWSTFRHLLTEEAARRHLQCMADSVRSGGIYVLGLHLMPADADLECTERWSTMWGKTRVTTTLRVLEADRRRRRERLRISVRVRSPKRDLRLQDEFELRMYSAAQFRRLLRSVPSWRLVDVYDFWYDINEPLRLDSQISDTLAVLQRL